MSGRDLTTRPQCTIHARGQICHFLCFPEPKREVRKSVMGHKSDCVATPYHPRGGETGRLQQGGKFSTRLTFQTF